MKLYIELMRRGQESSKHGQRKFSQNHPNVAGCRRQKIGDEIDALINCEVELGISKGTYVHSCGVIHGKLMAIHEQAKHNRGKRIPEGMNTKGAKGENELERTSKDQESGMYGVVCVPMKSERTEIRKEHSNKEVKGLHTAAKQRLSVAANHRPA